MNAIAKVTHQSVMAGTCKGTINGTEDFEAGLVVLSEAHYPPPLGVAHVMQATQRGAAPKYETKELKVSFTKGLADGKYGLLPDSTSVRVLFVDSSTPDKPVAYTNSIGIAELAFDADNSIFSGTISATLENRDEDTIRNVNLRVDFKALPTPPTRRIPRPPSSRRGPC
ncbi:hypothetical protein LOY52_13805 [Pseudomonas sp. B21-051]|uniref:hypothetical protein n=1 Tax=Pseudomonas sp. B21-051 TaxID=2895491 RepID=UPI002160A953|nr:hypothetical protein [Pseudomonas sp. B21-051]UVK85975.1 hypothetical protein LOY52_13805 [Pseudomonas sp. B21-051]